ncbi:MAG: (d)CMP kinase [Thiotrichales bacterium]|nr:(d)CMP kinase [Thiotrichales bacterium]MCY4350560.1 (d)CMP kinase [Thiotrichales bacterium]
MPTTDTVPVIAIDGPVGTGKGTVSHRVASTLGFSLLDSGALYRVLALAARTRGVSPDAGPALARLAESLDIEFAPGDAVQPVRVRLGGVDITDDIRTEQCGNDASRVSAHCEVRDALLARQHGFRRPPGLVADGRDMGSVVFPDACVKVFLVATARVRAERRHKQLMAKGIDVSVNRLYREMVERDRRDRERMVAPLKPAADAVVVDTTELDIDTVVARVLEIARTEMVAAYFRE